MNASDAIRVGYIPEHFSTPIQFAQLNGYFHQNGIKVQLIEFPSGTGHLIASLNNDEIDVAIGLTEGFVRGIADTTDSAELRYEIVGTYVSSPLNWAVSTGVARDDVKSLRDLENARIGVSRIGSGSYVMPFVLARDQHFDRPFKDLPVCHTFEQLRAAVNAKRCDAFMWEYFTTKKYYENPRELKIVGNIYTPWPSWVVVRNKKLSNPTTLAFTKSIDQGIKYFNDNHQKATQFIAEHLDYTEQDACEWLKTVEFNALGCDTFVDGRKVLEKTLAILHSAHVLNEEAAEEQAKGDLSGRILRTGVAHF